VTHPLSPVYGMGAILRISHRSRCVLLMAQRTEAASDIVARGTLGCFTGAAGSVLTLVLCSCITSASSDGRAKRLRRAYACRCHREAFATEHDQS
jgi:hypothetical protein